MSTFFYFFFEHFLKTRVYPWKHFGVFSLFSAIFADLALSLNQLHTSERRVLAFIGEFFFALIHAYSHLSQCDSAAELLPSAGCHGWVHPYI